MSAAGLDSGGLEELAGLICFRVAAWHDFGYENPPAPGCATIPPLGERSASAIEAGHQAVGDIDQLIARLHQVRARLVSELRQDEDIRAARVDAMLAEGARFCLETSDGLHCGHWPDGERCCACGQSGPEPDGDYDDCEPAL